MNNSLFKNTGALITLIGMIVMAAMIAVKVFMPETLFSGYALIVGIALFFIVEAIEKTPDSESGVRFNTILQDLRKPQVLLWVILPVVITVLNIILGKFVFEEFYTKYVNHVIGRTTLEMDFSNFLNWALVSAVTVFGEEIAFRGFLFGKGSKVLPVIVCLLLSAVLFAVAHMATGDTAIVVYDLLTIFVDAIFYAMVFKKCGNAVICFIPHCLNNYIGLLLVRVLFR